MPRGKKRDPFTCPVCGARVKEPVRTWTIVSPIPDRYGRITVTIMGSFECPNCGATWKDVVQKIKSGGDEPSGGEPGGSEEGTVIQIDLSDLDKLDSEGE